MEKGIYLVNFILMFLIARYQFNSVSDKTIIISALGLLVLLGLNLLLGISAQFDRKPIYKHFYYSALGVFVGAVLLLSM
jgi:hypothetical protein